MLSQALSWVITVTTGPTFSTLVLLLVRRVERLGCDLGEDRLLGEGAVGRAAGTMYGDDTQFFSTRTFGT